MKTLAHCIGAAAAVSLCSLAVSAAPAAAKVKETPRKNAVVLVVPFAVDEDEGQAAGFATAELITDLFAQENVGSWISSKQLDSALRRKDLQLYDASDLDVALPIAKALGATDLIVGEIIDREQVITLKAQRYSVVSKTIVREAAAEGTPDRLPALADELAEKLLDVSPKTAPMTDSAKAVEEAGVCWRELVRYPLQPHVGIPPPLDNAAEIEVRCQAALLADHQLGWAHAGLGVLKALKGDAAGARAELNSARRPGRFDAWLPIAESFAARRAGEEKASRAALEAAVKERPGFLMALGYLAEDRMDANDYKGAVEAWDRVLKRAPNHPYALGQKAKALGYLHKNHDALALTRRALDIDPGDPELLIELGSRQIDAKQNAEAEATLRQAMDARPPRPLAWLRLGYLYLTENRAQDAHDTLIEAVTYAYRDDEARTRAGIFADLALAAGMLKKEGEAVEYLQQAKNEGYGSLPCDAAELKGFKGKPAFDAVCAGK